MTSETCPSEWALDDADLHGGPAAAALSAHLAACQRCRARIEERRRLAARFDSQLAEVGWRRVVAARSTRGRRWRLGVLLSLCGGAAALLLLRAAPKPPEEYQGVKGALAVEVFARREGRVFRADSASPVQAGDELEVVIRTAERQARHVLVGSVDGTGRFSPFHPADQGGHSQPLPASGAPLLPPIVLDDAPGPERLLVLVSGTPVAVAAVRPLAEAAAREMRSIDRVAGVPVVSTWVTLSKQGRQR